MSLDDVLCLDAIMSSCSQILTHQVLFTINRPRGHLLLAKSWMKQAENSTCLNMYIMYRYHNSYYSQKFKRNI